MSSRNKIVEIRNQERALVMQPTLPTSGNLSHT